MIYKSALLCAILFFIFGCDENPTYTSDKMVETEINIENKPQNSLDDRPVMFYNVENLFDTENDPKNPGDDDFTSNSEMLWNPERYEKKLENLEKALFYANGKAPLMCGFAEIENRKVLEDLIKTNRLAKEKYKITHFDSEDRRGMDCGFIYDDSRFTPTLETKLTIRMDDDPNFRTRDILYIKGELNNGKVLHVFVNHWSSKREGEAETEPRRIQAAKTLRTKVDEILNFDEDANIVIMGDFNDTPMHKSIRDVLRARGEHELKKGDLVNLFLSEQKKDVGTAVHQRDWDVIDQLIVSKGIIQGQSGLRILKDSEHIVRHDDLLYFYKDGGSKPNSTYGGERYFGGFSDHLPVSMTLIGTDD